MAIDRSKYLERSPYEADAGNFIGVSPLKIPRDDLVALGSQTSPIKAIRSYCIECSGGSESEARKCVAVTCPLWPFRMGKNVFSGRFGKPNPKAKEWLHGGDDV